jgi:hypothetical protein
VFALLIHQQNTSFAAINSCGGTSISIMRSPLFRVRVYFRMRMRLAITVL